MTRTATSGPDPRILVIEDNISFQKLIRQRLKKRWPKSDVMIMDPTRGAKITPDFKATQFDVVLLDYELGELNGLDLLKQFRKHKGFPPVIMITATGSEELAVKVLRAGAADYMAKQELTQETLVRSIEEALTRHPKAQRQAPRDEPPPKIEGFEMLGRLGAGRASNVYHARRIKDGMEMALKVITTDLASKENQELIDRALREFSLMRDIESPRIAKILEQRFNDDDVLIGMELMPAGSVTKLMAKGKVERKRALAIVRDAALALADIHGAGVIHRDLKPNNMMLREDGSVALIDFGIARDLEDASGLTQAGQMLGTLAYVSPEQAQGKPVDPRTDLYSLGVVLFELLADKVPYHALTPLAVVQKHVHSPIPELPVDLWLYQVLVERLMAKSPEDRYPDAQAFIADLDSLAAAE